MEILPGCPVGKAEAFRSDILPHTTAIPRILMARYILRVFFFSRNNPVVNGDDEYPAEQLPGLGVKGRCNNCCIHTTYIGCRLNWNNPDCSGRLKKCTSGPDSVKDSN
jgi:hypothetical protein